MQFRYNQPQSNCTFYTESSNTSRAHVDMREIKLIRMTKNALQFSLALDTKANIVRCVYFACECMAKIDCI